jgi:hypothetical protein
VRVSLEIAGRVLDDFGVGHSKILFDSLLIIVMSESTSESIPLGDMWSLWYPRKSISFVNTVNGNYTNE